jgi:hypothetical protein
VLPLRRLTGPEANHPTTEFLISTDQECDRTYEPSLLGRYDDLREANGLQRRATHQGVPRYAGGVADRRMPTIKPARLLNGMTDRRRPTTFGRAEPGDIAVDDPAVTASHRHSQIIPHLHPRDGTPTLLPGQTLASRTRVLYRPTMEQQVRHWLNGRFGWGRRVIKVYLGEEGYRVEATDGSGNSARRRSWRPPTEEDALHLADELMSDGDGWRDVTHLGPDRTS